MPAATGPATGELRQFRQDVLLRRVQVTVHARQALSVRDVQLSAEGFASGPTSAVEVDLPRGAVVDLPTAYGPADCAASPGKATARLRLASGVDVVLPLNDSGLLERLHTGECADEALARQVEVSIDPDLTRGTRDGRPALRGTLRLTRRATGQAVLLSELGSHIIFTVRAEPRSPRALSTAPLVVLGRDQQAAALPFVLVPTRCDPHALAENKRAGVLGVYLALDDDPARLHTITPAPAVQKLLQDFAVDGCRAGGG